MQDNFGRMRVRCEDRFPTNIQGRYRYGRGLAKDVIVTDLSRSGCKFFDRFCNLDPGTIISIRIGSVGPLEATVRWSKNTVVGVQFEQALHESVFDHMLTTIPDWQAIESLSNASAGNSTAPEKPSPENVEISVRIRPPTSQDAKDAVAALQMQFPLRTEVEVVAVFHEILNRIFVAPDGAED